MSESEGGALHARKPAEGESRSTPLERSPAPDSATAPDFVQSVNNTLNLNYQAGVITELGQLSDDRFPVVHEQIVRDSDRHFELLQRVTTQHLALEKSSKQEMFGHMRAVRCLGFVIVIALLILTAAIYFRSPENATGVIAAVWGSAAGILAVIFVARHFESRDPPGSD